MRSIELFAGAGGLGMGAELAGFTPVGVIEWDRWACDTIRENQKRGHPLVADWPLVEGDVRKFDFEEVPKDIELLTGGPPCQPFSMGGKHRAYQDDRDMFPVTVNAVRTVRPKAFIIENVKGLTRSAFSNYFQYIKLQLTFPEVARKGDETWVDHLSRLEQVKTSKGIRGLRYEVLTRVLNAADFGVPQKRERVFFVGFRKDQSVKWSFPDPTHSQDSMLAEQWITREYWDRNEVPAKRSPKTPPGRLKGRIERLRRTNLEVLEETRPWMTVREALLDLPDPEKTKGKYHDHRFQPGARTYVGHTGSPLDLPAKTLKAGDHGVPGGENMLVKSNGEVRYFTVREAARLQTFPDAYHFHGAWSETMRQLGNAVPVTLAQVVASSVAEKLLQSEEANLVKRAKLEAKSD